MSSFSTAIVPPLVGNPVADVKAFEVPTPPVPAAAALNDPSKSLVKTPVIVPPYLPTPNPYPYV